MSLIDPSKKTYKISYKPLFDERRHTTWTNADSETDAVIKAGLVGLTILDVIEIDPKTGYRIKNTVDNK